MTQSSLGGDGPSPNTHLRFAKERYRRRGSDATVAAQVATLDVRTFVNVGFRRALMRNISLKEQPSFGQPRYDTLVADELMHVVCESGATRERGCSAKTCCKLFRL